MTQVFHIVPATTRPGLTLLLLLIPLVVMGIVMSLVFASFLGARSATFEISAQGLRLSGDLYGRVIPASELVSAEARRVNVTSGEFRPTARTGGTALPGYRSGWFRLANGERALLYLTDLNKVVRVPTTAGYSVLLSVAETDEFISRLREMGRAR